MLNENEFTEVEDRYYLNPQIGLDESTSFIDNLRATQGQQNQEIAQQTQMLGTDIPSQLGGLTSGDSYFTSRYQTPATNAAVANLRATAQAAALNQALENEQAMWKKRYQDAYRKYQKSAYDKTNNPTTTTKGGVDEISTKLSGVDKLVLTEDDMREGGALIVEPGSGNIIGEGFTGTNPRYVLQQDGSYKKYSPSSSSGVASVDLFELIPNLVTNYKKPTVKEPQAGFSGR